MPAYILYLCTNNVLWTLWDGKPIHSALHGKLENEGEKCICVYLQFSSVAQLCPTLCDLMDCSTPGFPVHHQLPEFTENHIHWVGNVIQPSHLLSPPSSPAFDLHQHQGLFKWIRWPKFWSFSFNISPSNEHSGLISLRMDWLNLLASKGLSKVFSNTIV